MTMAPTMGPAKVPMPPMKAMRSTAPERAAPSASAATIS